MILSSDLFRDIIRPCSSCQIPFDVRLHAPHVLPCSHTFCLMCLSKHEQRKKRHCFECKTKYSKFAANLALIEALRRIEERRLWLDSEMRRCDECDNRVPVKMMRRCTSCETQFTSRTDFPLECIICLECCVNSHNGHEMTRILLKESPSPSPIASPMLNNRSRRPSTSSTISVQFRPASQTNHRISKGIINTIKSWSFRSSANDLSFLLTPSSKIAFSEEDIVMQCSSPFYEKDSTSRAALSSSRMICMDTASPSNQDDISVDSVFDSPQSTIMHGAKQSPILMRSFCANDSGIQNTPPASDNRQTMMSQSSHSLRSMHHTPCSKFATISNHGSVNSSRNRIRMGVSDLINPNRAQFVPVPISPSGGSMKRATVTQMIGAQSEGSVFIKTARNPSYEYV